MKIMFSIDHEIRHGIKGYIILRTYRTFAKAVYQETDEANKLEKYISCEQKSRTKYLCICFRWNQYQLECAASNGNRYPPYPQVY